MHESGEMYLETIYVLCSKKPQVRSIDVAEEMGYSKPSVSRAVSILKKEGLITVDGDGFLTLTDDGLSHAKKIYERHKVLSKWLESVGVCAQTAAADACKMEHVISDETFDSLKKYVEGL